MLYQLDMASFFFYKISNLYLSVIFVTQVTYLLAYIAINICLEGVPHKWGEIFGDSVIVNAILY